MASAGTISPRTAVDPFPTEPRPTEARAPSSQVAHGSDEASAGIEIRSARPEERAAAWELQRQAFGLEERPGACGPALSEELRVVAGSDRVLSCLTLVHADISIAGAPMRMGGVRHVATHPDEQNRGYAGALLRETLQDLARQGTSAAVLFPFSFRYYRKFGFELGGNHCHVWCRPNSLPAFSERERCRAATAHDAQELAAFDVRRSAGHCCFVHRPQERWARLAGDASLTITVVGPPGAVAGYCVATESRDSYGGRVLNVLDLAAADQSAWRALLGRLSQAPVESIEWNASSIDIAASGILRSSAPLREGFKPRSIVTVRPMFQFRVVCLESALRAWAPLVPAGQYRLALRVTDELLPRNSRGWAVEGKGDWAEVRPARPGDPYLEADIRSFSQLFCGYLSATEALSQGLVRCSPAAEETAELLFPPREPFIPELDRF